MSFEEINLISDRFLDKIPKQRLITGGAAAMPVAGGLALAIRLCFHNHAPQQLPTYLTLEQQAAD